MHIIVCIKQVPEIALVRVDEKDGVTLPTGPGSMNPFDEYAVEEGIRLKEKHGGSVTVMSCGGDNSMNGLRDAMALGADRAVLLQDAAFADSDGVAIGRILAAGIQKIGDADLILFGKNAVDTDRSVVPGATAGFLDWAQTLFVKKIEAIEGRDVTVLRITEDGFDRVQLSLPAVISVVKEINEPRMPSLRGEDQGQERAGGEMVGFRSRRRRVTRRPELRHQGRGCTCAALAYRMRIPRRGTDAGR